MTCYLRNSKLFVTIGLGLSSIFRGPYLDSSKIELRGFVSKDIYLYSNFIYLYVINIPYKDKQILMVTNGHCLQSILFYNLDKRTQTNTETIFLNSFLHRLQIAWARSPSTVSRTLAVLHSSCLDKGTQFKQISTSSQGLFGSGRIQLSQLLFYTKRFVICYSPGFSLYADCNTAVFYYLI